MSDNKYIEGEELMQLVREQVARGQVIRYLPFRGRSMLPMLREGKDSVELSPLPEKLKKYDVPVYQYPSGKYVMHRVVAVKDGYYICVGDNLLAEEKIYPEQLIAVVSAFTRGGKRIELNDWKYVTYYRIWCALRPIRPLMKKTYKLLARIKKMLFSKKK